ncbi:MAG: hypothetical protein J4F48_15065, partial [Nitrospinae bacterium]|nr:hypothetical protein [Nitrospinota bacterium]
ATMGKADHRLVAFAESLARLGFAALVPDLPGMRRFRPEEADVARIERAFSWMTRDGADSFERCSILAFSFAAGPALRAAARPAVGGKMAAFIGVGAYYDLKNVLRHLTTSGGQNRPAFPGGLPIRHGKWLFLRYNLELLGLEAHRDRVAAVVSRKRKDEAADVSDLLFAAGGCARGRRLDGEQIPRAIRSAFCAAGSQTARAPAGLGDARRRSRGRGQEIFSARA